MRLQTNGVRKWREIRAAVLALPLTTLAEETGTYLRAECRSRAFGFIDDLEVQLRPEEGVIAVRGAARSGHYDFGVNRRRVEQLREALRARGLIQ